jgi:hypothetical protein
MIVAVLPTNKADQGKNTAIRFALIAENFSVRSVV